MRELRVTTFSVDDPSEDIIVGLLQRFLSEYEATKEEKDQLVYIYIYIYTHAHIQESMSTLLPKKGRRSIHPAHVKILISVGGLANVAMLILNRVTHNYY